jgi:hypothetical protein
MSEAYNKIDIKVGDIILFFNGSKKVLVEVTKSTLLYKNYYTRRMVKIRMLGAICLQKIKHQIPTISI